MSELTILVFGDIVARPGRIFLKKKIRALREQYGADFVVANAENSAGGLGIEPAIAREILGFGVDLITLGDHVWQKRSFHEYLDRDDSGCIRPGNYPSGAPGKGWHIFEHNGSRIGVLNIIGRTYFNFSLDCPFAYADQILEGPLKDCDAVICDFHAEATSEKVALGHYLDSRVSFVYGTHTHVQTADEMILDGGTAYITDLGMCGCYDSVIGMDREVAISRFISGVPRSYKVAKGRVALNGAAMTVSLETGKALSIERIVERGEL